MSARRTDFVDVLPTEDLKILLNLVKGNQVTPKDVGLAFENVSSYAMGQFLPGDPILFTSKKVMASSPPNAQDCVVALEAVMPDSSGTMKAGPVDKIAWGTILKTVLPFILSLFA